jgi:RNA polymerase sigma-70 factor (ECF subfamily)
MPDERSLLRQVSELDESGLGPVYDAYYPLLYRYIYHHVRHVETAEDLTAEVFHRLLESVEKGQGPERHLKAWLYRVAYNLVVDDSRRSLHRNHLSLNESLTVEGEEVPEQAHQSIVKQQAYAALDQLTEKQREVIILKFIENLDNAHVARILRMSVGSVKSLQHRGLAAMRRHLARVGAVTEDGDGLR